MYPCYTCYSCYSSRRNGQSVAGIATIAGGKSKNADSLPEPEAARQASRAEALIDQALQAGVVFRLVDPGPREIAGGRPFRIVLRYPGDRPRGLIDRLHASRAELYTAYTSAPRYQVERGYLR